MFCLCDRVDDTLFEGIKNKYTRKRISSLARKANGLLPMHILFDPNNIMTIHFTLLLKLHNLTGTPIKDLSSLLLMKP